jgi:hypothetical protein
VDGTVLVRDLSKLPTSLGFSVANGISLGFPLVSSSVFTKPSVFGSGVTAGGDGL